ncbi:MAG: ATP-binding protein [Burkholderiales bacterium]
MGPKIPSEFAGEVASEQVRLLYRNAIPAALVTATTSILLVWLQAQGHFPEGALTWLIAMLSITVIRVVLALCYARNPLRPGAVFWRKAFMIGVGFAGAGWMATVFLFMPIGDPVRQFATALVLAGMAAGAVPILSAVINAYYLFLSLTLLPAAVFFLLAGDITSIIIGLMTLIMMASLLQSARLLNKVLIDTLLLSVERARLAANLASAKDEIAKHNTTLLGEIEERRTAQVESLKAKDAAEAANKAKGEFLANMSHEVRTPLNAIIGMVEVALEWKLTQDQRHCVEIIDKASHSLLDILNDILDSSRIDTGRLKLVSLPFEPRSILADIATPLRMEAQAKGLMLRVYVSDEVPRCLLGDPGRLRQVLWNLIGNAVKFTEHGEIVVSLSGQPIGEERSRIVFSVHDSGIGIAKHLHERLFEPFSQVDTSSTRRFEGVGLGLSISKKLVEMMQGKLWFESDEDKGSEFRFEIDFKIAMPSVQSGETIATSPAKKIDYTGKRVLVVEDNAINQEIVRSIFDSMGCETSVADNGKIAVEKFQGSMIDAIFMDLHMPVMDGFEATKAIRELEIRKGGRVPIIALTANAMPETKQKCLDAGMDDYLTKPIRRATLIASLRHWVPVDDASAANGLQDRSTTPLSG